MAVEVGQALVRLAADSGGLQGDLDAAKGKTTSWAKGVGSAAKGLLTGAVLGGVTLVAGAVAGVGKAAFDMANDTQNAQAEVRSQFNQTAEEAERTARLARDSWGNNWGESITDVSVAMGTIQQQLGELGVTSDQEVTEMTQHAIGLRDVYGTEVGESVDAAKTLMENFGLSGQEAFDFIASGMQQGLDRSGDFLDTVNEYSVQFNEAGANSNQFFSALNSGLQGGMLGTDKAADAFKEFRVRIMDGSATTADALNQIGLNADDITGQLADGSMSVVEAWDLVTQKLKETDDEAIQMQAGVGLIGTQFEDLGADAVLAMDLWSTSTSELAGATDSLSAKYTSFGSMFEGIKRQALVSLAPISDVMLEIGNTVLPLIMGKLEAWAPIIENIAGNFAGFMEGLIANLQNGMDPIQAIIDAFLTWTSAGENLSGTALNLVLGLSDLWTGIQEALAPVLEAIGGFVSWKDVLIVLAGAVAAVVIPAVASLVLSLAPVLAVVAVVIGAVAALRNAWESNFLGIRDKVKAVIAFLVPFLQNAIETIRTWWAENGAEILASVQAVWNTIWSVIQSVLGFVWGVVQSFLGFIRAAWDEHGAGILAAASGAWNAIWSVISGLLNAIWGVIQDIAGAILGFWLEHGESIRAGAEEAWGKVEEIVNNIFSALQSALEGFTALFSGDWEGFGESIGEIWASIWDSAVAALEGLWALVSPVLSGFWDSFSGWFNDMDWIGLGKAIIQGLIDGLNSMAGALWSTVTGIVSGALSRGETAAEVESPSKRAGRLGQNIGKGLIMGLEDTASAVARAAGGLVAAAATTITNNNYYLTANYPMQSERSLAGDIRTMELLRS